MRERSCDKIPGSKRRGRQQSALGLALAGTTEPDTTHVDPLVPAKFNLEGAQPSTLS